MIRRGRARAVLLAVLAAAALASAPPASADVVVTNDGRTIEGKIVREDDAVVRIETRFGTIEVPRASVVRIERKETPEEELPRRRLDAKTAGDWFELSRWCAEKGMSKEARRCLETAVEIDPRHEAANRALGRVRDGDDWVTPEEKARRDEERKAAALAAQGLVEFRGRWMAPEEKEALEKGLVRLGDRWVTEDEARRARGLESFEGAWIEASEIPFRLRSREAAAEFGVASWKLVLSAHFAVQGAAEEAWLRTVSEGSERALGALDRLFGGDGAGSVLSAGIPPAPFAMPASQPIPRVELIVLEGDAEYGRAVDRTYRESKRFLWEGWDERARRTHGYFVHEPLGVSVALLRGRDLDQAAGQTFHHVGHVLANRHGHVPSLLPPWYDEALACLAEAAAWERNTIFCAHSRSVPRAEGSGGTTTGGERRSDARAGRWEDELRASIAAGRPQSLLAIVQKDLPDLTIDDVRKSMSVVQFLAQKAPGGLDRFHRLVRKLWGLQRIPDRARVFHDQAFREAFGLDVAGVEAEWTQWVPRR